MGAKKKTVEELFQGTGLTKNYLIEFRKLRHKLRRIKKRSVGEIERILIDKAKFRIISDAKSFRAIGKVFRKRVHDEAIDTFLKKPDMRVFELLEKVTSPQHEETKKDDENLRQLYALLEKKVLSLEKQMAEVTQYIEYLKKAPK